ncbi:MAG: hypothetical protein ACJ71J_15725 [Nitrososphaeraceae archaeon]
MIKILHIDYIAHPVGAARIDNPLRITDKGTPTAAAPPPNRIPFFIQSLHEYLEMLKIHLH